MPKPPPSRRERADQIPTTRIQTPCCYRSSALLRGKTAACTYDRIRRLERWKLSHEGASAPPDGFGSVGSLRRPGTKVCTAGGEERARETAVRGDGRRVQQARRSGGRSPQGRAVGRRDCPVREDGQAQAQVCGGLLVSRNGVLLARQVHGMPRQV